MFRLDNLVAILPVNQRGKCNAYRSTWSIVELKKKICWDFPGGPAVKNPPCIAGDTGLTPGQGTEIPHATAQLSLRTTTTEFERLN